MALPLWVVVAPFVWAPIIAAAVGWCAVRAVDWQKGSRTSRLVVVGVSAALVGLAALRVEPSPVLHAWHLPAQLGLAACCIAGAALGGWTSMRRRRPTDPTARERAGHAVPDGARRDTFGVTLLGLLFGGLVAVVSLATLAVVTFAALDDPLFELAVLPSDRPTLLAVAQHALAAEEPAIARARAELAERAGADPTDVARIVADAWAADGNCRRAWASIERGARLAGQRDTTLQLREGVVGPTLARRCPPALEAP